MISGKLYIISAPSGAGKTSLVAALIESLDLITVSTSHTTRVKRAGETSGEHYHFTTVDRFEELITEGAFLEYAKVFDHYYGTARTSIIDQLEAGNDVILEIDWQGAQQVRQRMPEASSIFILPPSKMALQDRLEGRGQDSAEIIARRMQDAVSETSHYHEYDYLIINDDFDQALVELRSIFMANRLESKAMIEKHTGLLADLLA